MFTPQSLLSLPGKSRERLPFRKWKGTPVEGPGAYTCVFGGMLPHFCRKLVIVVNFFKVCIFLLKGRRVTTSEWSHSKTCSSSWEGKLWLLIIKRPICSYRLHSQPPPQTLVTGFGHFWEGLEFSEKLNVSYRIVRLVHVKCCGKPVSSVRIALYCSIKLQTMGLWKVRWQVSLLLCAPKSNTWVSPSHRIWLMCKQKHAIEKWYSMA